MNTSKNLDQNLIAFSPAWEDTNSLCSAGDSLDAHSIIDHNVTRLEESIRALKSRSDELSPISRLPDEILCVTYSSFLSLKAGRGGQSF